MWYAVFINVEVREQGHRLVLQFNIKQTYFQLNGEVGNKDHCWCTGMCFSFRWDMIQLCHDKMLCKTT